MILRNAILAAALVATSPALAAGSHEGGHYSFGEPGKPDDAARTIAIKATDDMRYVHDAFTITKGETVRFVVVNTGTIPHEFSVGDAASQRAHAAMMAKMPDMKHENDPSAVHVAPGETKEVVWKFSKPVQGTIELACQIPGHYDAGMKSKVKFLMK